MKLCWLTDPHFNFLDPPGAIGAFGKYIRAEQDFDAIVITGDISEADRVRGSLNEFAKAVECPVYFTLGNHDFYRGSLESVYEDMKRLEDNLVWLDRSNPIVLNEEAVLTGNQGWYDAHYGNAEKSNVGLADFEFIADLEPFYHRWHWMKKGGRAGMIKKLRELGQKSAESAGFRVFGALEHYETVVFATHVPPFQGACWHEGAISDSDWLPWFTCKAMGDMLLEAASKFPDKQIMVLCGHTHSDGTYQPTENLTVITGKAVYGAPDIAGIFTFE